MEELENRDEALFAALRKKKKKKRRKLIRTVILITVLLGILLTAGILYLRKKIAERVTGDEDDIVSVQATRGSISTQVSGSGTLINEEEETLSLPAGVAVSEMLVSAGDRISEGDLLARIDTVSVMTAMEDLETEMSTVDSEIYTASSDTISTLISSGVTGRVKKIYAQKGDDVIGCMAEYGALALLSLDGYMYTEIETDAVSTGEQVLVMRENGTEYSGLVDLAVNGTAVILVTDDGPQIDESVTVYTVSGQLLGTGTLQIHSQLRITGTSGTIAYTYLIENQIVCSGGNAFALTDTSYYARYQTLLNERTEMEETFLELMQLYQTGGVLAPYSGSVVSISYDEDTADTSTETDLLTISPDKKMEVTVSVDESNILSLEIGQTAEVTVSSIGDDTYPGTVTEINKSANSSSGVTTYSAVVTVDKTEEMLQGMTAKVVIRIQGVDNTVIIPVEALHQTSSTSYVYTAYDEETHEFGGLVTVIVGISNSTYAEITSGLQEGDTVYYTKEEDSRAGGMNAGRMDGRTGNGMQSMTGGGSFGGNGGGNGGGSPRG